MPTPLFWFVLVLFTRIDHLGAAALVDVGAESVSGMDICHHKHKALLYLVR